MKRLAIVLLTLMAVPAIADPDPDDTSEAKKPKKKKGKKKKKKPDETKKKPTSDEIEINDDPTATPPPVVTNGGSTTVVDAPRDPNAAAMAPVTATPVANATPIEMTKRPLVLQTGRLDVGGYIAIPRGPDYQSTTANDPIGKWIGFDLRAEYGAIDKLAVGLTIDLAPVTSDAPATEQASSKIGGFVAEAKYALIDGQRTNDPEPLQLAGHVSLGVLKRGAPALGPFSFPLYGPDLEPALGLGVAVQKTFMEQKLALITDPRLFFQASGHQTVDATTMMQVQDALITLQVPLYVTYQAAPNISVGGRTGIYTGQKFSFSPKENLAIPFVAEGVFTAMKNQLDVGVDLGLGNLTPHGSTSIVGTFVLGIFATFRTK